MNNQLQDFARNEILEGLKRLPESNQILFKRMYSHDYGTDDDGLSYPKKGGPYLDKTISEVVKYMPDDKLDWAMTQIENTLKKQGL